MTRGKTPSERNVQRPKPPKRLREEILGRRNRSLNAQTRKQLRRHYAARYRVR